MGNEIDETDEVSVLTKGKWRTSGHVPPREARTYPPRITDRASKQRERWIQYAWQGGYTQCETDIAEHGHVPLGIDSKGDAVTDIGLKWDDWQTIVNSFDESGILEALESNAAFFVMIWRDGYAWRSDSE